MATQYTLTGSFTAITEEKGTIQNVGTESVELASTTNATAGEGIILLPGEKRTFNGSLSARSMGDATADVNVVDFTEAGEGGDVMTGASASADGTSGLVPLPTAGNENRFLRGDGSWAVPTDEDTQYQPATQLADGLMSATDKTNLDNIESNYRQPSTAYTAGQIAYHSALPPGRYLECTTAGITGSGALTISGTGIGTTVTDGTVVWMISKSLSVMGEAMHGTTINRNVNTSNLQLIGGHEAANGAGLTLYGSDWGDSSDGAFNLKAVKSSNSYNLKGFPNGNLQWEGNDLAGSAIVAKSLGQNGYIKYASGLIMQWGRILIATSSTQITLPVSFSNTDYTFICTPNRDTGNDMPVVTTGNYATGSCYGKASIDTYVRWIAIGY